MKHSQLFLFKLCLLVAFWGFLGFCEGQAPAITWQKSLGGSDYDRPNSIQQTTDGGYIVAGFSDSYNGDVTGNHGGYDYWIVKLDANGNVSWKKSLGGSSADRATSIEQTSDGGYIVVGVSYSNDGDVMGNHGNGHTDYWIVKLDANGIVSWQKCLGGSGYDDASSIQQTMDGGYIVAGSSESIDGDVTGNHGGGDSWVVKLDSSGNLSWQKCLGGSGIDGASSIQQTTDGGYIVVGISGSVDGDVSGNHGGYDYWIVKLDTSGNLSWEKSLGGGGDDWGSSIEQTTDEGYIVAGRSESNDGDVTMNHGYMDYWIVKLDANGTLSWQKSLGGNGTDDAFCIQQTTDGGYIVGGLSSSTVGDVTVNYGYMDYLIVKLDASGNLSWQKSLGGSKDDWGYSIEQTTDGGYIMAGLSKSNDGDVTGNHGGSDYWIVKLSGVGVGIYEASMVGGLSVSPNPVVEKIITVGYHLSAVTEVEMSIMDALGNCVWSEEGVRESEGEHRRVIGVGGLASGVYFVEVRTEYGRGSVKMVKE